MCQFPVIFDDDLKLIDIRKKLDEYILHIYNNFRNLISSKLSLDMFKELINFIKFDSNVNQLIFIGKKDLKRHMFCFFDYPTNLHEFFITIDPNTLSIIHTSMNG